MKNFLFFIAGFRGKVINCHMIQSCSYWLLNRIGQALKGTNYQLDPSLPVSAMAGIGHRRLVWFLRSIVKGIYWSKRSFVGRNVELRNRRYIHIGRCVTLGNGVLIDGLSREGVLIGDHVSIGDFSRIEASGTITDIGRGISIGSNTGIGSFSFIGGAGGVSIGSDVIMGQWVSFHPENHNFGDLDMPIRLQGVTRQGITLEDDCWVGVKATFLDGSYVGKGSIVAAGAVVNAKFPPYSIIAGVPAKLIKRRNEAET